MTAISRLHKLETDGNVTRFFIVLTLKKINRQQEEWMEIHLHVVRDFCGFGLYSMEQIVTADTTRLLSAFKAIKPKNQHNSHAIYSTIFATQAQQTVWFVAAVVYIMAPPPPTPFIRPHPSLHSIFMRWIHFNQVVKRNHLRYRNAHKRKTKCSYPNDVRILNGKIVTLIYFSFVFNGFGVFFGSTFVRCVPVCSFGFRSVGVSFLGSFTFAWTNWKEKKISTVHRNKCLFVGAIWLTKCG